MKNKQVNDFVNKLYFGDCLTILKDFYNKNKYGFIDLVYCDPPFNSKKNYNILFEDFEINDVKAQKEAFADTWSNVSYKDTLFEIQKTDLDLYEFLESLDRIRVSKSAVSYLTIMAIRIWYIHKVIKDSGSFYLHCDPTMSHYLKIICDLIFGEKNFKNEIIWHYRRWTGDAKGFMKMHDVILFYAKNKDKIKFNVLYTDYTEKSLARKQFYHTRIKGGDVYETEIDEKGVKENDVWNIQLLNSQSKERLGYPTQKPVALLERIISASSNKGDIVADFFCGCGTTIIAAQNLNRHWIGVDISHLAIGLIERKRLIEPYKSSKKKSVYEIHGFPQDIASTKELAENVKGGRLEFQDWIIEAKLGGICNPKKTADGGWDGYTTFTIDPKEKSDKVLIEVKSGNVNVKNIREFIQVVNRNKASIGVFVCYKAQVTKPMMQDAKQEGYFRQDLFGSKFDKIQILTVEDILENKEIHIPESNRTLFKSTSIAQEKKNNQIKLGFDKDN